MSHSTRVLLFPLLLLCTSSSHAIVSHQTGRELRDLCREFIASVDVGSGTLSEDQRSQRQINVGQCLGFIQGAVDGFNLAMATWKVPTSVKACMPKEATTDELVRVFLKYIDDHPEDLSYAAADIVWRAMVASYPCPAK